MKQFFSFKSIIVGVLFISMQFASAQLTDAYYLSSGERISGKIYPSDLESLNRPNATIKWYEGEAFRVLEVKNIDEIGLGTDTKFKKFTVQIDDVDLYNVRVGDIRPTYVQQTLFLTVLVEGEASLYQYQSGKGHKFFYRKGADAIPKQLTYRKFKRKADGDVEENTTFRNQLQSDVSCPDDPWEKFRKVKYEREGLSKIVESYNLCKGGSGAVSGAFLNEKKSKMLNRFSVFANGKYVMPSVNGSAEGDAPIAVGGGVEFESITAGRKFGFFLRGEVEKISFEDATNIFRFTATQTETVTSFEYDATNLTFMVGARYHTKRAEENHLYFDAGLGMMFPFGEITGTQTQRPVNGPSQPSTPIGPFSTDLSLYFSVGAGYQINERWGVQLRYDSTKNLVTKRTIGSDIGYSSINLGVIYALFRNPK